MSAVQNSRVLFTYVITMSDMPVSPDANTIYFVQDTKQIYVGDVLIADNYAAQKPNFVISGEGDCIVSAAYDAVTNTLTLTYGDLPDVYEYTIARAGTPDYGYSATYQLLKNNVPVGDKINIPSDMVVSSGSVVEIMYSNSRLWDGATDVTEIIKGPGGTATADDAGAYIKLIIANKTQDKVYIKATDLVDTYTVEAGATQVQLAISQSNEISATLVAGGVGSTELADNAVTASKISIAAHSESQVAGSDGLAFSVTTTNGQVSAVSGSIAPNTYDAYGAAADAIATWTVIS